MFGFMTLEIAPKNRAEGAQSAALISAQSNAPSVVLIFESFLFPLSPERYDIQKIRFFNRNRTRPTILRASSSPAVA